MSIRETILAERMFEGRELPAGFSEDLSDDALKSIFSDYGWVFLCKLTNNTSRNIKFYNPYYDKTGEIEAGQSDSSGCTGYLPLWSHSRRYEVSYYSDTFEDWKMMKVKDLDNNWLISFEHDGIDEDIRAFYPAIAIRTLINLVIKDNGYEVYCAEENCLIANFVFQHRY